MNFVFPILILMDSDFKRVPWFVVAAGIVILTGHYIDIFQLISPATVGDSWSIGIPELGSLAFFMGLFIFVVFSSIAKAPLARQRKSIYERKRNLSLLDNTYKKKVAFDWQPFFLIRIDY